MKVANSTTKTETLEEKLFVLLQLKKKLFLNLPWTHSRPISWIPYKDSYYISCFKFCLMKNVKNIFSLQGKKLTSQIIRGKQPTIKPGEWQTLEYL